MASASAVRPRFLPMNTIFASALVSSEEPKLFQMFGEACLQISQISEGASIKSCTPSQISILMVDSGKWGVKVPTCCLFFYSSFLHRPSLGSPSSEQKEGFVLNFFSPHLFLTPERWKSLGQPK